MPSLPVQGSDDGVWGSLLNAWLIVAKKADGTLKDIEVNLRTSSYTLGLSDIGKIIEMNASSANTLTVPANSSVPFPIGTLIVVDQIGSGQTTIVAGSGATIRTPGSASAMKIQSQYGSVVLRKRATDEWVLVGDLTTNVVVVPSSSIYWGARIDGAFYALSPYNLAVANDAPWCQVDPAPNSWDMFEIHAGKAVTAVHWGGGGAGIGTFDTTANSRTRARAAFSNYTMSLSTEQVNDMAANSNTHGHITTLQTWATAAASQGHPIMLRPMWEMNGNWGYHWQTAQGISAATYVLAWRRVHAIISAIAPNISFFWCPNQIGGSVPDPTPWYPGNAYVDWVGFDGYNMAGGYSTPSALFDTTLAAILAASSNAKPVAIGETGCEAPVNSPGKAVWVGQFFDWLESHTEIKFFSWFNETGSVVRPHIEIGDSSSTYGGAVQTAFATRIANPRYLGNIVNTTSFPSNAKVPIPT